MPARDDGTMFLNKKEVPRDGLLESVGAALAARDETTLFLEADERLGYGRVLDVMSTSRQAGAAEIS